LLIEAAESSHGLSLRASSIAMMHCSFPAFAPRSCSRQHQHLRQLRAAYFPVPRRCSHSLAAISRHSDADLSAAMPACFISLIRSASIVARKYLLPAGGAFFGTEGLASLAFELFFPAISYAPSAWFSRKNGPTRCVSQQAQSYQSGSYSPTFLNASNYFRMTYLAENTPISGGSPMSIYP
jgi:hypothetical protein